MQKMSINEWCAVSAEVRTEKGFFTPPDIDGVNADLMLGKLMLVVTEVAEAAEAVRKGNKAGFIEELADTAIRLFDICGTADIDLEDAIRIKTDINRERPVRHGKKTAI